MRYGYTTAISSNTLSNRTDKPRLSELRRVAVDPAVAVGAVLVGAAKLAARTERGTMLVNLTAGVAAAGAIGIFVLVTMS